jgi:hypothetical protein
MRTAHVIFILMGLVVAGFLLIGMLGNLSASSRLNHLPHRGESFWIFFFLIGTVLIALIGGGSFINLARRRLALWPTVAAIIGCFLSICLLPLGIWGIILPIYERKKQRRHHSR